MGRLAGRQRLDHYLHPHPAGSGGATGPTGPLGPTGPGGGATGPTWPSDHFGLVTDLSVEGRSLE